MRTRFLFITLLAALGLAGCFTSTKPLFTDDQAVAPYAKITFVKHGSTDDKTALTREGKAYVTKTKDGTTTMRFMPLGDELYLAEFRRRDAGQVHAPLWRGQAGPSEEVGDDLQDLRP